MQLLGKSLDNLMEIKKKFTIKTVCLLAYQMISVLEYIHNRHIIHRDIKPDNFVMGVHAKNAMLYILDFGLAKKYRSSTTLEQYPMVNKKKLTGTARYASINALSGLEQSRRDDLEAVGYVLMYFLRGSLPWQGLKLKSKEDRYKKILEKKKETSSSDLCAGYPVQFKDFIDYTRRLEYTEEPNYDMLKDSFYNLVVEEMGEKFDYVYDWTTQEDLDKRKKGSGGLSDVGSIIASESKGNASVVFTPKIRKNRSDMTKSNGNTMTIYKSTRSDVNQKIITDSRGGASDKVETKCCMM